MRCDGPMTDDGVSLVLPGQTTSIATARAFVRDQIGRAAGDRTDDIILVVSELVTNAFEYGAGDIEVRLVSQPTAIELVVSSESGGLPSPSELPDAEALRGRGLPIVESLSDNVAISADHDMVTVTCRFDLSG